LDTSYDNDNRLSWYCNVYEEIVFLGYI
jgi:hypothetical protein